MSRLDRDCQARGPEPTFSSRLKRTARFLIYFAMNVQSKKKPTIGTVAEAAGVAVSTVSRYLNGHSVSAPVRARLSEVIATLGYSRSWTARNLSLGRRGCIGVIVDSSEDPWFVQLLTGIEEELSARDTGLMLSSLALRGQYDPTLVFSWTRDRR